MKKTIKFCVISALFGFLLLNLVTIREAKAEYQNTYGEEIIFCPQGAPVFSVYRCSASGQGCCISCQQLCYPN